MDTKDKKQEQRMALIAELAKSNPALQSALEGQSRMMKKLAGALHENDSVSINGEHIIDGATAKRLKKKPRRYKP